MIPPCGLHGVCLPCDHECSCCSCLPGVRRKHLAARPTDESEAGARKRQLGVGRGGGFALVWSLLTCCDICYSRASERDTSHGRLVPTSLALAHGALRGAGTVSSPSCSRLADSGRVCTSLHGLTDHLQPLPPPHPILPPPPSAGASRFGYDPSIEARMSYPTNAPRAVSASCTRPVAEPRHHQVRSPPGQAILLRRHLGRYHTSYRPC